MECVGHFVNSYSSFVNEYGSFVNAYGSFVNAYGSFVNHIVLFFIYGSFKEYLWQLFVKYIVLFYGMYRAFSEFIRLFCECIRLFCESHSALLRNM